MRKVEAIAPTPDTVLITGETGVGKELVAEALHALSPRRRGPLVKVNCGAIPESLIDSELFGHEKGAFTGATLSRPGYFEQANGGTIYLDEIGELPPQAQVRLLRVLDAREVQRVGGTRRISLDVRVVAATHRDLWDMVQKGLFRKDLWYRLNVFPLYIPALRERRKDISILAQHFYKQSVREREIRNPPKLTYQLMEEINAQDWDGNVRELRYVVERSVLLSSIENDYAVKLAGNPSATTQAAKQKRSGKAKELSEADILAALEQAGGKIQGKEGAAALLGLSPSTLRDRMKKHGVALPEQRKA